MARGELPTFLRSRREGLRPGDVGLAVAGSRRTPGLRREEVAELARMSVDYYVRLEQARGPRTSARILESLAAALRLPPAERAHLFRLAGVALSAPAGELGRLRVNCDVLTVPEDDQQVVFMTADPDTPTARALRDLAAFGRSSQWPRTVLHVTPVTAPA